MEELELRQYWNIIKKRFKLVIAIPVLALIVSGVYSYWYVTPQYQANTTLLVNQKSVSSQAIMQDIQSSQALINTYTQIIKSRTVEGAVISDLNLHMNVGQLDNMVSVSSPDQSQVIDVAVTSSSIQLSAKIANEMGKVFQQQASKIMNVKNVQVVDKAIAPTNAAPVKPNKKLNLAIALVLGLMVSIGLAFLLEYLDTRMKTEEDINRYLNLPVLGSIVDASGEI